METQLPTSQNFPRFCERHQNRVFWPFPGGHTRYSPDHCPTTKTWTSRELSTGPQVYRRKDLGQTTTVCQLWDPPMILQKRPLAELVWFTLQETFSPCYCGKLGESHSGRPQRYLGAGINRTSLVWIWECTSRANSGWCPHACLAPRGHV